MEHIDVYFNPNRQYLISLVRFISKPLPKSMLQVLQQLEDLQLDDVPAHITATFSQYNQIYLSRRKEWPGAEYGIRLINCLIYFHNFDFIKRQFNYWINEYILHTQKIPTFMQTQLKQYQKVQRANIFGIEGPFNMDFVSDEVYNAAYDIHVKRHWSELPMFADICDEYGCTDSTILNYLRNTHLHKDLRVHCWVIELILRSEINKWAQRSTFHSEAKWLGW